MAYHKIYFTVRNDANLEVIKELNVGDAANPTTYEQAALVYGELIKDSAVVSTIDKIVQVP